jgi:hypothetical protein
LLLVFGHIALLIYYSGIPIEPRRGAARAALQKSKTYTNRKTLVFIERSRIVVTVGKAAWIRLQGCKAAGRRVCAEQTISPTIAA